MKRTITESFLEWKNLPERKVFLLEGARQTGKTYTIKEFAQNNFGSYHYFDFMKNKELNKIFEFNLEPKRIIQELELFQDRDINIDRDLIIFDEIQECPKALTSLKFFTQNHPNSFICGLGSFLGLALSNDSFPVGKVTRRTLYPMSFYEFLLALGQDRICKAIYDEKNLTQISEILHKKTWDLYKTYMITGGLPEVVKTYILNSNSLNTALQAVRTLQNEIYTSYLDDITKHSGEIKAVKISSVFNNVPIQLARENKQHNKFVFNDVLQNSSRYSTLSGPIEWLIKAGLIIKVPICEKIEIPLKAYTLENRFKLYLFDIGILGAMLNLSPKAIINYDYGSYKGFFAENTVLQELQTAIGKTVYSWMRNTSEIEFIIEDGENIYPIEVKTGINKKAKSLQVYKGFYSPKKTFLLSGCNLNLNNGYYPLYLASRLSTYFN